MPSPISPLSALWAVAVLTLLPPEPLFADHEDLNRQEPRPTTGRLDLVVYAGKITKRDGQYVLQDSTMPIPFLLDDQPQAKRFAGQDVAVTGVITGMDNTRVSVHVQKIEPVEQ